ncbi:MAG: carboxypeptidase-like regulatory domain-containing protein [Terriglobales bacterium]
MTQRSDSGHKMGVKQLGIVGLILIVFGLAAAANGYSPKDKEKPLPGRTLTGKVLDKRDNPLTDAVVYLADTRTRAVKSYIVGPDGAYHFPELSPNVDYEIYAQFKNLKSDTKTVSQFDDRKQVNIVLRIDVK